ncbi:MAG: hypothetical protein RLZZ65_1923 [Bacteroidota bacterium]|jgi:gliding motility-associated-like protein
MTESDNIKDLFAKGLQDHQVAVDPAIWSAVSSSIGATAAPVGLSVLSKIVIGTVLSAGLAVGAYFFTRPEAPQTLSNQNPAVITSKNHVVKGIQKNVGKVNQSNSTNTSIELTPTRIDCAIPTLPENVVPAPTNTTNGVGTPNNLQNHSTSTLQNQVNTIAAPRPSQVNTLGSNGVSQALLNSIVNTRANQETEANNQPPTLSSIKTSRKINLPNVFTPNQDGQNDFLAIDWGTENITDFSVVVLNRENGIAYQSSNPNFEWDGTDQGGEKLKGTFIYFVTGTLNGQKWQQSGSLQIIY